MDCKTIRIFLIISLSILYLGCAATKGEFKRAQEQDTIEAYQGFLERHIEGALAVKAKVRIIELEIELELEAAKIRELEFKKTRKDGTLRAYNEFIAKYPNSQQAREASGKIPILELGEMGPGNRFVIPVSIGNPGSKANVIFVDNSVDGADFINYGGDLVMVAGEGSVFEFSGKTFLENETVYMSGRRHHFPSGLVGIIFEGHPANPLKFILVHPHGLIYLSGKGQVTLRNGKVVSLP